MSLHLVRARLPILIVAIPITIAGCAGNLPRLCLRPDQQTRWSALPAPPEAASKLESMAKAAPPGFAGQPIAQHTHSYWYGDAHGGVLLCHQIPGSSDYCFSEVWIFARRDDQWRIEGSAWNMCTE